MESNNGKVSIVMKNALCDAKRHMASKRKSSHGFTLINAIIEKILEKQFTSAKSMSNQQARYKVE